MASIVAKLREIGQTDKRLAEEVRRSLVETLFVSSTSLGTGAVAGAVISSAIAISTRDPWLVGIAVAIALTGMLRVVHAVFFYHQNRNGEAADTRSEILYELGAWVFATLLGGLVLFSLLRSNNSLHHLMAAAVTSGYAAGICGRNAGRPVIAIGQLALAQTPLTLGLFLSSDPLRWVLGAVNIVFHDRHDRHHPAEPIRQCSRQCRQLRSRSG